MKKKILIVEDNIDIQEIYTIFFEEAGFLVYNSYDWFRGIIDVVDKKPDVILVDLMMPDIDGFELLRTIQEQSSIKIPTIVCSNLSQASDKQKAHELWADLFLVKADYQWAEIVTAVTDFLKQYELNHLQED